MLTKYMWAIVTRNDCPHARRLGMPGSQAAARQQLSSQAARQQPGSQAAAKQQTGSQAAAKQQPTNNQAAAKQQPGSQMQRRVNSLGKHMKAHWSYGRNRPSEIPHHQELEPLG